jgi:hypothetical protein
MNMDFPHPRRGLQQASRRSNFAALVATASARQTISRTARAMLATDAPQSFNNNTLAARISYFANTKRFAAQPPSGGFLPNGAELADQTEVKYETAVNLAGSINCKFPALNGDLFDREQPSRGREI